MVGLGYIKNGEDRAVTCVLSASVIFTTVCALAASTGIVQLYVPSFVSPVAISVNVSPSILYSNVRLSLTVPSVVQVISSVSPATQIESIVGDVIVTVGSPIVKTSESPAINSCVSLPAGIVVSITLTCMLMPTASGIVQL